jgi:hypothetical protein
MQLHDWQEKLQDKIIYPDRQDNILDEWLNSEHMDKRVQLEIYNYAYVARLLEALQSNYPAVHQLLGDDEFARMGKRYLDNHPSSQPSIRWFGDRLALFLANTKPYSDLPVLPELAQFEWALRHTIDAADADRLQAADLQGVAESEWATLQFSLQPSVTLLEFQWNTPQVWKSLTTENTVSDVDNADEVEPARQLGYWLVYRREDMISGWRSVSIPEQRALTCLKQGGTFADLCEQVEKFNGDAGLAPEGGAAMQMAGFLRSWIAAGILNHL